jgi:hypothetical protein
MKSAGDIGRGDVTDDLFVSADLVSAERFPHVAVNIYGNVHILLARNFPQEEMGLMNSWVRY